MAVLLLVAAAPCPGAADADVRFLEVTTGRLEAGAVVEVASSGGFEGELEVALFEELDYMGLLADRLLAPTAAGKVMAWRSRTSAALGVPQGGSLRLRLPVGAGIDRTGGLAWTLRGKGGETIAHGEVRPGAEQSVGSHRPVICLCDAQPERLGGLQARSISPDRAPLLRGSYRGVLAVVAPAGALSRLSPDALEVLLDVVAVGATRLVIVGPIPAGLPELDGLVAGIARRIWNGSGGDEVRGGPFGRGSILVALGPEIEGDGLAWLEARVPASLLLAGFGGPARAPGDLEESALGEVLASARRSLWSYAAISTVVLLVLWAMPRLRRAPSVVATAAGALAFGIAPGALQLARAPGGAAEPTLASSVRIARAGDPHVRTYVRARGTLPLAPGPWVFASTVEAALETIPTTPVLRAIVGRDGRWELRAAPVVPGIDVVLAAWRRESGASRLEARVTREGSRIRGMVRSSCPLTDAALLDPWGQHLAIGALAPGREAALDACRPLAPGETAAWLAELRGFLWQCDRSPLLVGLAPGGVLEVLELEEVAPRSAFVSVVAASHDGCTLEIPELLLLSLVPGGSPRGSVDEYGLRHVEMVSEPEGPAWGGTFGQVSLQEVVP